MRKRWSKKGNKESKYWMVAEKLQAELSGSAVWKFLEDRGTVIHELDEIKRDPERDSSISMEFLS